MKLDCLPSCSQCKKKRRKSINIIVKKTSKPSQMEQKEAFMVRTLIEPIISLLCSKFIDDANLEKALIFWLAFLHKDFISSGYCLL